MTPEPTEGGSGTPTLSLLSQAGPREQPQVSATLRQTLQDLHLDQVARLGAPGRGRWGLSEFLSLPSTSIDQIRYRQDVFADLDRRPLGRAVRDFAERMDAVRALIESSRRMLHPVQSAVFHLDAARSYCSAVEALAGDLATLQPRSEAMRRLAAHLHGLRSSPDVVELEKRAESVAEAVRGLRYCVKVEGLHVQVSAYEGEADLGTEVAALFSRFDRGASRDHHAEFPDRDDVDDVEEQVLDRVVALHPQVFAQLARLQADVPHFLDPTIERFDREVHMYLAFLDLVDELRAAGGSFCYPEVSTSKVTVSRGAFDLALAVKALRVGREDGAEPLFPVPNDFHLDGDERILVVTGPNQGGKSTFARTFGQLHHLASIGAPVPGSHAELLACDQVLTHFEVETTSSDLDGKLKEELVRAERILGLATARSVVVMNEVFASTTLDDARWLGARTIEHLLERDLLAVYVTFVDELSRIDARVVSMVSSVDDDEAATRTFEVVRRPADGLAHAAVLAHRHGLSYEDLLRRLAR